MTEKQYRQFLKASKNITNNDKDAQDLMHDVLIMLDKNETFNNLSNSDKLFFFIRAIKNQFNSNSSYYTRNYKKYSFTELNKDFDVSDTIYEEKPSLDWIKEIMEQEIHKNPDFWYQKGIFELWIEHKGFIERIHKQTRIPRYSIKETIDGTKKWINQKWKEQNGKS
jgi:hypothetical protein